MASIITLGDLEQWIPGGIDAEQEGLAQVNVDAASLVVTDTAKHPEWTRATAPARARLIAVQLAKRSFLNPGAVVRSNVGPLGESIVEDYARTLELTPRELEELEGFRPAGIDTSGGQLFVLNMGDAAVAPAHTIYVPDMSGTLLPMYAVGEIGSP